MSNPREDLTRAGDLFFVPPREVFGQEEPRAGSYLAGPERFRYEASLLRKIALDVCDRVAREMTHYPHDFWLSQQWAQVVGMLNSPRSVSHCCLTLPMD